MQHFRSLLISGQICALCRTVRQTEGCRSVVTLPHAPSFLFHTRHNTSSRRLLLRLPYSFSIKTPLASSLTDSTFVFQLSFQRATVRHTTRDRSETTKEEEKEGEGKSLITILVQASRSASSDRVVPNTKYSKIEKQNKLGRSGERTGAPRRSRSVYGRKASPS